MKKGQIKPTMLKLQTFNWNKLTPREQDKALLFMYEILGRLGENRKYGFDKEYWASYP